MQELIERLERNIKEMPNEVNTFTQGYKAGLNFVIECATTSLEKEKEQIIDAYMIAAINNTDKEKWHSLDKEYFEICANEYFKKHFNQN